MNSLTRSTIEEAWQRAAARCECKQAHHHHAGGQCNKPLNWINRGRHGEGAWEAQRKLTSNGEAGMDVHILCWDCHAKDIA